MYSEAANDAEVGLFGVSSDRACSSRQPNAPVPLWRTPAPAAANCAALAAPVFRGPAPGVAPGGRMHFYHPSWAVLRLTAHARIHPSAGFVHVTRKSAPRPVPLLSHSQIRT